MINSKDRTMHQRIAVVIADLGGGGAQRVLHGLVLDWLRFDIEVTVITISAEHKDVYDNDLIHFSYDGTHYLYTFRSKVKNDIVKLKDSFKDSTIIDYSIDFSSDEG